MQVILIRAGFHSIHYKQVFPKLQKNKFTEMLMSNLNDGAHKYLCRLQTILSELTSYIQFYQICCCQIQRNFSIKKNKLLTRHVSSADLEIFSFLMILPGKFGKNLRTGFGYKKNQADDNSKANSNTITNRICIITNMSPYLMWWR